MPNFSLADSVFKGSVRRIEASIEGGEKNATLSFSGFITLFSILNRLGYGFLAENIFVVGDGINDNVVMRERRRSNEDSGNSEKDIEGNDNSCIPSLTLFDP